MQVLTHERIQKDIRSVIEMRLQQIAPEYGQQVEQKKEGIPKVVIDVGIIAVAFVALILLGGFEAALEVVISACIIPLAFGLIRLLILILRAVGTSGGRRSPSVKQLRKMLQSLPTLRYQVQSVKMKQKMITKNQCGVLLNNGQRDLYLPLDKNTYDVITPETVFCLVTDEKLKPMLLYRFTETEIFGLQYLV